jgi:hypothetical protein
MERAAAPVAQVPSVRVETHAQLPAALDGLGIGREHPVLVLVGGAGGMSDPDLALAGTLMDDVIGPALRDRAGVIVDGGTDAGVMRLAGETRERLGNAFDLVGVVPEGQLADGFAPEPRHSALLVVPGTSWGDESPWLLPVARQIAGAAPVAMLLINGGTVARKETLAAWQQGVATIVVSGSGRAADELADGTHAGARGDNVTIVRADERERLRRVLAELLGGGSEGEEMAAGESQPASAGSAVMPHRSERDGLRAMIDAYPVSDTQREVLRERWLSQVEWMSRKAEESRSRYHVLRLTTVIGGVIVPALVSISLGRPDVDPLLWLTFGVSLVVAISAAIEGFFRYGEKWRHYRGTAEVLKSEGWQLLTGTGRYRKQSDPEEAFKTFVDQVEDILRGDVEGYLTQVTRTTPSERFDVFTRI